MLFLNTFFKVMNKVFLRILSCLFACRTVITVIYFLKILITCNPILMVLIQPTTGKVVESSLTNFTKTEGHFSTEQSISTFLEIQTRK